MPYSADLRHSYAKTEMNISWLQQILDDADIKVEFQQTADGFESLFWEKCDEWVNDYLKAKVFWTGELPKDTPKDILHSTSIYEFLQERMWDYLVAHKSHLSHLSNSDGQIHPPCDRCGEPYLECAEDDGALCKKCEGELMEEEEKEMIGKTTQAQVKQLLEEVKNLPPNHPDTQHGMKVAFEWLKRWSPYLSRGDHLQLEKWDTHKEFDRIDAWCACSADNLAFFKFHKDATTPVLGVWNYDKR